jgi:hypothetical protein
VGAEVIQTYEEPTELLGKIHCTTYWLWPSLLEIVGLESFELPFEKLHLRALIPAVDKLPFA